MAFQIEQSNHQFLACKLMQLMRTRARESLQIAQYTQNKFYDRNRTLYMFTVMKKFISFGQELNFDLKSAASKVKSPRTQQLEAVLNYFSPAASHKQRPTKFGNLRCK